MELEQPVLSAPIQFHVEPIFLEDLRTLPWHLPISEWHLHGVRILEVRHGEARHEVIFVKTPRFAFCIKQIGEEALARREASNYEMLLLNGIHTLVPAGIVTREEVHVAGGGSLPERTQTAHTVTLLAEHVLPDSELFRRKFSPESRRAIWDAIAELFVELHTNGILWGDASLANTLVKFEKLDVPFVGRRTVLKAYLADAETVEVRRELSRAEREAELESFFASMDAVNDELRLAGSAPDARPSAEDQSYFRSRYELLSGAEEKKKDFFRRTGFNMDEVLGRVTRPEYVDLFLAHIDEHKWYLNERAAAEGRPEVSTEEATQDWFERIFSPLCRLFRTEGILDFFPGKTAAELYIEIMTNKYYMSRRAGADVGMLQAMSDYAERFGAAEQTQSFRMRLAETMKSLLGFAPVQERKG